MLSPARVSGTRTSYVIGDAPQIHRFQEAVEAESLLLDRVTNPAPVSIPSPPLPPYEITQWLEAHCFDPRNVRTRDSFGSSPMLVACREGNLAMAQNLYSMGAHDDVQNQTDTPKFQANSGKWFSIAESTLQTLHVGSQTCVK